MELENVNIQENVEITKEDVIMQLRKMPNWKYQGWTLFRGFSLRVYCSTSELTEKLNENIQFLSIPSWLVKSRTVLIQKDPAKSNTVGNYWLIANLNML